MRIFHELGNVGQADEAEILEAETEEQRMEVAAGITENVLRRQWTMLVSVIGVPSLPIGGVAGRIDAEQSPLDEGQLFASLLAQSPDVQSAQASVERAEAALFRAKRENVPDLTLRAGLHKNHEAAQRPSRSKGRPARLRRNRRASSSLGPQSGWHRCIDSRSRGRQERSEACRTHA